MITVLEHAMKGALDDLQEQFLLRDEKISRTKAQTILAYIMTRASFVTAVADRMFKEISDPVTGELKNVWDGQQLVADAEKYLNRFKQAGDLMSQHEILLEKEKSTGGAK